MFILFPVRALGLFLEIVRFLGQWSCGVTMSAAKFPKYQRSDVSALPFRLKPQDRQGIKSISDLLTCRQDDEDKETTIESIMVSGHSYIEYQH